MAHVHFLVRHVHIVHVGTDTRHCAEPCVTKTATTTAVGIETSTHFIVIFATKSSTVRIAIKIREIRGI